MVTDPTRASSRRSTARAPVARCRALGRVTLASLLVLGVLVRDGRAAATRPTLVLSAAAGSGVDGARAAVFEGTFDFANAIEIGYPLDLVVFQGARFVCYSGDGPVLEGANAVLADGELTSDELPALMATGSEAGPEVRIVTFASDRLRITLPRSFAAGPTRAVLFTPNSHGTVVSNPVQFLLP